ncbi:hypothetical protein ACLOJK_029507 [Asimina triloba]
MKIQCQCAKTCTAGALIIVDRRSTVIAPITVLYHPRQGRQPWLSSDPFRRVSDPTIGTGQKQDDDHIFQIRRAPLMSTASSPLSKGSSPSPAAASSIFSSNLGIFPKIDGEQGSKDRRRQLIFPTSGISSSSHSTGSRQIGVMAGVVDPPAEIPKSIFEKSIGPSEASISGNNNTSHQSRPPQQPIFDSGDGERPPAGVRPFSFLKSDDGRNSEPIRAVYNRWTSVISSQIPAATDQHPNPL